MQASNSVPQLMRTIAGIPSVPERTRRRAMAIYAALTGEIIDKPLTGNFSDIFEELFGMGGFKPGRFH